jgi:hypothetical protein
MTIPPIPFRWEGDVMRPERPRLADQHFTVGERYVLVEHHERSEASHRHYFAAIHDAWQSLPDELMAEYPTAEHLRKKMLVKTGYADERSIVCANKAEAQRVGAFARPLDSFAVVIVREAVVRVYTAQSQSTKAMGPKAFQESKTKVLDAINDLLGVRDAA